MDAGTVREIFRYDNGKLFWLKPKKKSFIGQEAGFLANTGYWRIKIFGKQYKRSRLVWLYHKREWPKYQIDHKNRIKTDDRIENLRDVTNQVNCSNKGVRIDNKLGVKGVYLKGGRFYTAKNGKHIGVFSNIEEASIAYMSM